MNLTLEKVKDKIVSPKVDNFQLILRKGYLLTLICDDKFKK